MRDGTNDREEEIRIQVPQGPRFVIKSRGDSYLARDSRGYVWTVYLPSAMAWTSREAAESWRDVTRLNGSEDFSGAQVEDVTGWATAPILTVAQ